jgi:hypothetical protein
MPLRRHQPLALAAALASAGRGAGTAPLGEPATPTGLAQCNHPGGRHADGVGFAGAALHWSSREHDAGQDGELFVCLAPRTSGRFRMLAPAGVEVSRRG